MILRTASFIAGVQAAGVSVFIAVAGTSLAHARVRILSLGRFAAFAGLLLTSAHYLVEPARMAGSMSGVLDPVMHAMLLDTNIATAAFARVAGLALLVMSLRGSSRLGIWASLVGTAMFVTSFTLVGHTVTHDLRWLLIAMLVCHLIVVAYWFGSLLPLAIVARKEDTSVTSAVIEQFSRIASWVVPVIFLVGLVMSILLLGQWENLWTPYGKLLLAKIAGFAILMALATLNKWRFGPAIGRASSAALVAFRRTAIAEWFLIAAVLAATALMTGLYSPTHSG
jgi:putative copper resistance protein D